VTGALDGTAAGAIPAAPVAAAAPAGRAPGPTLAEAIREFEGWFAGEMLRLASRASAGAGALGGGSGGRLYREMFFEQIGRLVARSGGLGLARSLGADAADAGAAGAGGAGRAGA
jgi:Rod binding domain-containing protein